MQMAVVEEEEETEECAQLEDAQDEEEVQPLPVVEVTFPFTYPNPYPNGASCVYLISQPVGTYVNISFLSMDIDCQKVQTSGGLKADYIELRDGYSEDSPIMAKICGNGSNVPIVIMTTQNHLRIR